jgi:hypothetical protein
MDPVLAQCSLHIRLSNLSLLVQVGIQEKDWMPGGSAPATPELPNSAPTPDFHAAWKC